MSLSDKGVKCKCEICLKKGSIINYSQKNVKEFIRKLKESIEPFKEVKKIMIPDIANPKEKKAVDLFVELNKKLDKLAGEKLKC